MILKGLVVFLSAFLLFLLQPIVAKLILPRFGGGVAVWATCLVFFQTALLLGYGLAHGLVRGARQRAWHVGHRGLLLTSLALLPIVPIAQAPALAVFGPGVQILLLLTLSIGLPFTLLAMTSPLLQAWMAGAHVGFNPYRLFALSNLASLAALLAYPWLIEPWLRTATQALAWSAAYVAYVAVLLLISLRRPAAALRHAAANAAGSEDRAPTWQRTTGWFALAALGSYELVAVTNHLTQNIPSFPMMWLLPLVIYLASFTLCFDGDRWYAPRAYRAATLLAVLAMALLLYRERQIHNLGWPIGGFLLGLFVACMFCHGELARSRPAPSRLTHFYLAVSAGGVFGGAVVALGAPALLPGYFELEIGLVLVALAVLWRVGHAGRSWVAAALLVLLVSLATTVWRVQDAGRQVIEMSRNFYGVLRIRDHAADRPADHERVMIHGSVLHGQQFLAPERRHKPTSYYTPASGVGRLLTTLSDRPLQVGAIGLGAGTIAAYGKAGDRYRFFEIDPAIVAAAQRHFSFIADSPAVVELRVGDGRLLLQAEAPASFDVLVVDAFAGDAIPTHLLTREAVALYRRRLKPGGVIALHLSNSHLDLRGVVQRIAADLDLQLAYVADPGIEGDVGSAASDWILLAEDRAILDRPAIAQAAKAVPHRVAARVWTDDYSNIVQVLSLRLLD